MKSYGHSFKITCDKIAVSVIREQRIALYKSIDYLINYWTVQRHAGDFRPQVDTFLQDDRLENSE